MMRRVIYSKYSGTVQAAGPTSCLHIDAIMTALQKERKIPTLGFFAASFTPPDGSMGSSLLLTDDQLAVATTATEMGGVVQCAAVVR